MKFMKEMIIPPNLRITKSRVIDNARIKYRDVWSILNQHLLWDKTKIVQIMWENSDKTSKLIAIMNKDKPQVRVGNLIPIQILPTSVRLV